MKDAELTINSDLGLIEFDDAIHNLKYDLDLGMGSLRFYFIGDSYVEEYLCKVKNVSRQLEVHFCKNCYGDRFEAAGISLLKDLEVHFCKNCYGDRFEVAGIFLLKDLAVVDGFFGEGMMLFSIVLERVEATYELKKTSNRD